MVHLHPQPSRKPKNILHSSHYAPRKDPLEGGACDKKFWPLRPDAVHTAGERPSVRDDAKSSQQILDMACYKMARPEAKNGILESCLIEA